MNEMSEESLYDVCKVGPKIEGSISLCLTLYKWGGTDL